MPGGPSRAGARLQIHPDCKYLIRTLPALPLSPTNSEDVDTNADDHAYDAVAGWLMARTPHVERAKVRTGVPALVVLILLIALLVAVGLREASQQQLG